MSANLYALFQKSFPENRQTPALMLTDDQKISYAAFDLATARMARCLLQLGLTKGDRVAMQTIKSPEALYIYLACLRLGFVFLPLNMAYTAEEVRYFINDAQPALLICDPELVDELRPIAEHVQAQCHTLDAKGQGSLMTGFEDLSPCHDLADMATDDLATILYTSGTTGQPKGAMLSHGNLASNALTLHKIWGWQQGDVLIHALPIFHAHGLFVATHCALLNGSPMWFLPKFDLEAILRLLPQATILMGVPTFYTRLLSHPGLTPDLCRKMRLFISGSAPLLPTTFTDFEQRTGHRILERYGMSEAGMITSNPLDGERQAGSVGFPLPDIDIRVCSEDGNPVPSGDSGILEIKGPNLFRGYWNMPEKTSQEFREDGFFITGDIAQQMPDGRINLIGRAKDLIISGGYNIYPKELETILDQVEGVHETAIIGVADCDFGESVCCYVVKEKDCPISNDLMAEKLSLTAHQFLARFKHPKCYLFLEELPRNSMGKVQKNRLRQNHL